MGNPRTRTAGQDVFGPDERAALAPAGSRAVRFRGTFTKRGSEHSEKLKLELLRRCQPFAPKPTKKANPCAGRHHGIEGPTWRKHPRAYGKGLPMASGRSLAGST